MADLAVFASGSGSNFQAIAERLANEPHRIVCLICDQPAAPVLERARKLGIDACCVPYIKGRRNEAELTILQQVTDRNTRVIALAGFMKLLSPWFIDHFDGPIVNVHPSLLPAHPGTNAIEKCFLSDDTEYGITIHRVDHGLDTGPILVQERLARTGSETLQTMTERVHAL